MPTYREVAGGDRSRLPQQVAAQRARVSVRLERVRSVVAIMSGKGGVGKSFVTAALALGCAERLRGPVGVLDADLHGPTAAHLLGARGPVSLTDDGVRPAVGNAGIRVFSTELLVAENAPLRWRTQAEEAFVWRGALETGVLREFLADVAWGSLDLLLVDLPPGTGLLTDLGQLVPSLRGVVAVTIPSEESRRSVCRAMEAARAAEIPLLGVIENMSEYVCPGCGTGRPLFNGAAGERLAHEFHVPLLGRVPFTPGVGGDSPFRGFTATILDRFLEGLVT